MLVSFSTSAMNFKEDASPPLKRSPGGANRTKTPRSGDGQRRTEDDEEGSPVVMISRVNGSVAIKNNDPGLGGPSVRPSFCPLTTLTIDVTIQEIRIVCPTVPIVTLRTRAIRETKRRMLLLQLKSP